MTGHYILPETTHRVDTLCRSNLEQLGLQDQVLWFMIRLLISALNRLDSEAPNLDDIEPSVQSDSSSSAFKE